jgi:hypothetical protein
VRADLTTREARAAEGRGLPVGRSSGRKFRMPVSGPSPIVPPVEGVSFLVPTDQATPEGHHALAIVSRIDLAPRRTGARVLIGSVQGGAARIVGNRITGDILFDEQGRLLVANRNRIGGNLQAFQNDGGVRINNNRIDGNLQCKENVPAPTGGGNQVGGNKEDQCEGL